MKRTLLFALVAWAAAPASAADPPKVDRSIGREPAYKTKSPKYLLLAFGPGAKDRVWLVQDGGTLHVDRNGNGDLTDPGEAVAAVKPREGVTPEEGEFTFPVGDLTVGGRTHKGFSLSTLPLSVYSGLGEELDEGAKAALAKDPKTTAAYLGGDVDVPGVKGGGAGGRVSFSAGPIDANGALRPADRPADAPVIRLGGPLEITFSGRAPALRVGRARDFVLVVGSPGVGPGSFAAVQYEDTIPKTAHPVAEVEFRPATAGAPPVRERYELKHRC